MFIRFKNGSTWAVIGSDNYDIRHQRRSHHHSLARFDAARCARGIESLRSYQAEGDENLRTYKRTPKHDFASHAADAWRYLAMAWKEPVPPTKNRTPLQSY